MAVLIGCEESQNTTLAMRDLGIEAYSCDLKPTRGNPSWHYQCNIFDLLTGASAWDLIVLHPDCTAMAVSGNRWYGRGMPRHEERQRAIAMTLSMYDAAKARSKYVALENPVSVIFSHISDPVQYIQPWMFGHGETKKTGLALHNLPILKPTNIVEGREQKIWKMAPSPTRKRDRSTTYPGVSDAIARQWGLLATS